jgi:hypothetical protein
MEQAAENRSNSNRTTNKNLNLLRTKNRIIAELNRKILNEKGNKPISVKKMKKNKSHFLHNRRTNAL